MSGNDMDETALVAAEKISTLRHHADAPPSGSDPRARQVDAARARDADAGYAGANNPCGAATPVLVRHACFEQS